MTNVIFYATFLLGVHVQTKAHVVKGSKTPLLDKIFDMNETGVMAQNTLKPHTPELPTAASRLGTQPVGKLLFQFSIPAITGMLLNALYNVVDRIFVGRGVNEIALGGISLVLPLMTITMAFAMLFGTGASNMISMRLGQQRKEDAEKALSHGFWLLIASGLLITGIEFLFFDQIFARLGAQEDSAAIGYARPYYMITLAGSVLFTVSFGLSHCARAQGFPLVSMIGMIIGAVANTILDPLFIFGFGWGVEGAAIASIISWGLSTIWLLSFSMSKKAVVRLRLRPPRFDPAIVKTILGFGSAQFIMQFIMAFVQLILNHSMGKYGPAAMGTAQGGDIAISAMNIVGTITMLIFMPIFGLAQGSQPVLGYNYGAKQFRRVKKALLDTIGAASAICVAGFLVVMIVPTAIVHIFVGEGSPELLKWTPWALRVACIMLPFTGFQVIAANLFVVTGRPKISILLSLTRQCLALIPLIFIFGHLWGLAGVVCSIPVADAISLVLTAVFIASELKKINEAARQYRSVEEREREQWDTQ